MAEDNQDNAARGTESNRNTPNFRIDRKGAGGLYPAIRGLLEKTDIVTINTGETVGEIDFPEGFLLRKVKTNIVGTHQFQSYKPYEERQGRYIGVGEKVPKFGVNTSLTLGKGTFVTEGKLKSIVAKLQEGGWQVEPVENDPFRSHVVQKDGQEYVYRPGFVDAASAIAFYSEEKKKTEAKGYESSHYQKIIEKVNTSTFQMPTSIRLHTPPEAYSDLLPIESQEQVERHLTGAMELTEAIVNQLCAGVAEERSFDMPWISPSVGLYIWNNYESGHPEKLLDRYSIKQINEALIRAIVAGRQEKNAPDFVSDGKVNSDILELLNDIENHFEGKQIDSEQDLLSMPEKERVLLALGLLLKGFKGAYVLMDGEGFFVNDSPSLAGITMRRYGKSQRDRFEFYLQQDRKYGYKRDSVEAADFLLLHASFLDSEEAETRYESIQSANLQRARNYVAELEATKMGDYSVEDVKKINTLLLEDIVPPGEGGKYRQKDSAISGRVNPTEPYFIPSELNRLLRLAKEILENKDLEGDAKLRETVKLWTYFDAIHPMEEGNGRTGTLLFDSWRRVAFGDNLHFISSRSDNGELVRAMSLALKSDSQYEFGINNVESLLNSADIDPLIDFVKKHLVVHQEQAL